MEKNVGGGTTLHVQANGRAGRAPSALDRTVGECFDGKPRGKQPRRAVSTVRDIASEGGGCTRRSAAPEPALQAADCDPDRLRTFAKRDRTSLEMRLAQIDTLVVDVDVLRRRVVRVASRRSQAEEGRRRRRRSRTRRMSRVSRTRVGSVLDSFALAGAPRRSRTKSRISGVEWATIDGLDGTKGLRRFRGCWRRRRALRTSGLRARRQSSRFRAERVVCNRHVRLLAVPTIRPPELADRRFVAAGGALGSERERKAGVTPKPKASRSLPRVPPAPRTARYEQSSTKLCLRAGVAAHAAKKKVFCVALTAGASTLAFSCCFFAVFSVSVAASARRVDPCAPRPSARDRGRLRASQTAPHPPFCSPISSTRAENARHERRRLERPLSLAREPPLSRPRIEPPVAPGERPLPLFSPAERVARGGSVTEIKCAGRGA